jgi:hypothetical protein
MQKTVREVFDALKVTDPVFETALRARGNRAQRRLFHREEAVPERRFLFGHHPLGDRLPDDDVHRAVRARPHRRLGRAVERDDLRSRQKIGRPRQLYTGPDQRDYVPVQRLPIPQSPRRLHWARAPAHRSGSAALRLCGSHPLTRKAASGRKRSEQRHFTFLVFRQPEQLRQRLPGRGCRVGRKKLRQRTERWSGHEAARRPRISAVLRPESPVRPSRSSPAAAERPAGRSTGRSSARFLRHRARPAPTCRRPAPCPLRECAWTPGFEAAGRPGRCPRAAEARARPPRLEPASS